VSPNGNLPTSASRPLLRETQAVLDEQGGEGVLSGAAAASDESGEESFLESDDESLTAETAGMSCTSSPDEIVVETVDDNEESINNGEDNQEDSVLVVEIHDEAPDEVIAVYEEADPGLFADDDSNDDEVVANAADDISRPRAK